MLSPLSTSDVVNAAAAATDRAVDDPAIVAAAAAAGGSVGRALDLLDGDTLSLLQTINALLARLPEVDPRALHALGDALAGNDAGPLATFVDAVSDWLTARLHAGQESLPRLAQVAQVWEKVAAAARDVEAYNLERKPLVFNVFGMLAETARH
jgi:DNA polymerase-3 subunit delta'